jgi:hypothetical protein
MALDALRSRPGVRFAPSGLRTVLDEAAFRSPDGAGGSRECAIRRRTPGRLLIEAKRFRFRKDGLSLFGETHQSRALTVMGFARKSSTHPTAMSPRGLDVSMQLHLH